MVQEKYAVRLSSEDREQLRGLIHSGRHSARVINRARILLKTDEGWSASQVAAALDTSQRTVFRTKRRYVEEGLEGVLHDHPQANRYRKLDDRGEAHPVSSTGQAMEDVLDLYAEPYDPDRPVVCFDETSTQLLAEVRAPLPVRPRRPRRQDYEYRRDGTRNIFLTCEPLAGWRHVAITERRTMQDFAHQMQWLVDVAYPDARVVRVVLDNPVSSTGQALNTHRMASLYETFPAAEARRIVKRLEFHHTPKHASWLNMAEIEFSALSRTCLKRRNPDADALQRQITAYETERNAAGVTINWRFSTQDARSKLHRLYPCLSRLD